MRLLLMRVFVVSCLLTLGVSAYKVGIFAEKADKRVVPIRADGKPIPVCLPGDTSCQPGLTR